MNSENSDATAEPLPFLDLEGTSIWFPRVEDTDEKIIVGPRGIPMWLVFLCVPVPAGGFIWALVEHKIPPPMDVVGTAMVAVSVPGFVSFFWAINKYIESFGTYFVLEKNQRKLLLPRLKLELDASQIAGFVEVHGWSISKDRWGSESSWKAELSVIAHGTTGQLSRHSVLVNDASQPISNWGKKLAEFFEVECRVYKVPTFPSVARWWSRLRLSDRSDAGHK